LDFSPLAASILREKSNRRVEKSRAKELLESKLLGASDLPDLGPEQVKIDKFPAGQFKEKRVYSGCQLR
jgi:hypothetical protein